jgi:AmmeMemoRadiSam system protein A
MAAMLDAVTLGPELCQVARDAIREHVFRGTSPDVTRAGAPKAGVFVTLKNPDGSLRGCIGSITPVEADLVGETARSAVLAATRDPRFPPVRPEEVEGLEIEVSVLMPEEPIRDASELDPTTYGIIVRHASGRRGLLLPAIEGIDDGKQQLRVAMNKAGIAPDEPVSLSRFRVLKWESHA